MSPKKKTFSRYSPQSQHQKGRFAEWWASLFLFLKGYRLLKYRYQNPLGEIDLILKKGKTIIFCEVKTRPSLQEGLYALTPHQQKRIINGARHFQAYHKHFYQYDCRFDYIVVYKGRCHHIKNAWDDH